MLVYVSFYFLADCTLDFQNGDRLPSWILIHSLCQKFKLSLISTWTKLVITHYITDALVSLHWMQVPERIQYKVAVLCYRVLHGSAPRYLGPLTRVADVPGRRTLRSAATNRTVSQTLHCRQPSFSGCRFLHLELALWVHRQRI